MYMIAFMKISIEEGISKKIVTQAAAISKVKGKCTLLCVDSDSMFQEIEFHDGNYVSKRSYQTKISLDSKSLNRVNGFIDEVEKIISEQPDEIYVRHMMPSARYVRFLRKFRKSGIICEIPTYPYFYEQLKASHNKLVTILRLANEVLFWPFLYSCFTKILCIPCRSKAHKYKKMQFITNGYTSELNASYTDMFCRNEDSNKDELVLVGIGHIYKYHGYEKMIKLLSSDNNYKVKFIVIGNGEIEYLKAMADELGVNDKVDFVGVKTGQELESYYQIADVGIGTLSLELRKADIDTGIKVLDYYIHGLPVISSGKCPDIDELDTKCVRNLNEFSTIEEIKKWSDSIKFEDRKMIMKLALEQFSWTAIMEKAL